MADPNAPQNNAAPQTPPPAGGPFDQQPPGNLVSAESPDAKTMGMLAHLLAIFTSFIGPLIIWMTKKDQSPFVNQQGKEALNWAITIAIGWAAIVLISILAAFLPPIGFANCLLWPAVGICNIVFYILSTIEVNKGKPYRYPFCIRLIS